MLFRSVWFGTEDAGLFQFDPITRKFTPKFTGLIHSNIHGLYMDEDELWVGTFSKGLFSVNLKTNVVKSFLGSYGDQHKLHAKDIFSIFKKKDGNLLISTTAGLYEYNKPSKTFHHYAHLGYTFVYTVYEDDQENIWAGTYSDGLYLYEKQNDEWHNFRIGNAEGSLPHLSSLH